MSVEGAHDARLPVVVDLRAIVGKMTLASSKRQPWRSRLISSAKWARKKHGNRKSCPSFRGEDVNTDLCRSKNNRTEESRA